MVTGKPVDHECYVLPPEALGVEYLGNIEQAIEIIQKAKPLRVHRGMKLK
jgi:hypothetical protein